MLDEAVPIFYKKVLADDLLSQVFKKIDMDTQGRNMIKFMTFAFGGSKDYTGRSMKAVHKGLGITIEMFMAVAGHL